MENMELKSYAKCHKVPLWKVAIRLNISEATMTRKLRVQLNEDETKKIMRIIDELSKGE